MHGHRTYNHSKFMHEYAVYAWHCQRVQFCLVVEVPTSPAYSFISLLIFLSIAPALPTKFGLLPCPSIFLSQTPVFPASASSWMKKMEMAVVGSVYQHRLWIGWLVSLSTFWQTPVSLGWGCRCGVWGPGSFHCCLPTSWLRCIMWWQRMAVVN